MVIQVIETSPDLVESVGLAQWKLDERLTSAIEQGADSQVEIGEWLEKQLAIAQLMLMNAATVPTLRQKVESSLRDLAIHTTRHSPFLPQQ